MEKSRRARRRSGVDGVESEGVAACTATGRLVIRRPPTSLDSHAFDDDSRRRDAGAQSSPYAPRYSEHDSSETRPHHPHEGVRATPRSHGGHGLGCRRAAAQGRPPAREQGAAAAPVDVIG